MSKWSEDKSGLMVPKGLERLTPAQKARMTKAKPNPGQMTLHQEFLKGGVPRSPSQIVNRVAKIAAVRDGGMSDKQKTAQSVLERMAQREEQRQAKRERAAQEAEHKYQQHRAEKKAEHKRKGRGR
ncbi:hypothetical protein [Gordonia sp. (in: high G+C Gram-positive bacteria)]|uniref:hypothetical protein n=1 Tax=Gordonia sp. (in: high G+C Gram-positive bacteria) TaxID=84139 RepID=UPI003F97711C